jgi:hypothetical protein
MMGAITFLLSKMGKRFAFWGAVSGALIIGAWLLVRRGRIEAEAQIAIRLAEARIRAMQIAREARHEVHNADRDELDRRADRWMRD